MKFCVLLLLLCLTGSLLALRQDDLDHSFSLENDYSDDEENDWDVLSADTMMTMEESIERQREAAYQQQLLSIQIHIQNLRSSNPRYARNQHPLDYCANSELWDNKCYEPCHMAYSKGFGLECWQKCAQGYTDNGSFCFGGVLHMYFKHLYYKKFVGYPTCAPNEETLPGNSGVCLAACAMYYRVDPSDNRYCII